MRMRGLSHNLTKLNSKRKQSSGFCTEIKAYYSENWSLLIRNHISKGSPEKAVRLYTRIRSDGFHASGVVPLVLKACSLLSLTGHAMALHAESLKLGTDTDALLGTSLVSAYAKCGALRDARKMFDQMPHRNPITWNAMIGGYFKNHDSESASALFERMPERTSVTWREMITGFSRIRDTAKARKLFDLVPRELKNLVTWTVMVDGYCANGEMDSAREVFDRMPERNSFAWSSMVSGYCKTGDVKEGRAMFDRIPRKNLVNWNSMISGYVQNGFSEEALTIFHEMREQGFEPDQVTAATVLSACAQSGSLELGEEIHRSMIEKRMKPNRIVLNALVDMYAKCGDLGKAKVIFESTEEGERGTACWNAMISGLAANGRSGEALELFRRMVEPDKITFLAAFSACAHGGLVDEGVEIFSKKMVKHGVEANVKHYGCLVDLLGRSGRLREAFDLIKKMPMEPNDTVWGAMLGACRIHSDAKMTERVVAELETPDPKSGWEPKKSHYALLSNIYAASEKWEKAMRIRIDMANQGLEKTPGFSSVAP